MSIRSAFACVFALLLSACGGSSTGDQSTAEKAAGQKQQPPASAPATAQKTSPQAPAPQPAATTVAAEPGTAATSPKASASSPPAPKPVRPVIEQPPEPVYIVKDKGVVTTPTGLRYVDLVAGKGASPKRGQTAVVHYIGTLANDSVFDDSRKRKDPLECRMGTGRYLRGWEEGLSSMKVGGKRKLIIPPRLGYGRAGNKKMGIPPNAYVIFEVELVAVR